MKLDRVAIIGVCALATYEALSVLWPALVALIEPKHGAVVAVALAAVLIMLLGFLVALSGAAVVGLYKWVTKQ